MNSNGSGKCVNCRQISEELYPSKYNGELVCVPCAKIIERIIWSWPWKQREYGRK